ncbi:esterase/lipase family protein [Chiayiivirga flava]|uniref:Pimeloyl-ACP methyl ester carboxylesterase n=1 Tax=Chiayiivirga flava TaxID=659595 RepID=A0A7W8D472_9GAMM|nr:alpha/beta fold hydrolase [Chiayiivirga flava]MBB5207177.1 pimeloyl-ACP methyl ester carboxylesterase [Chiayiivirga flava]
MSDPVLILHGLWMRAPAMQPLARRLRADGFAPATFDYASRAVDPEASCRRLAERIGAFDGRPVHLVGHSLGGLLALETLTRHVGLAVGRVVCLGSPLRGASAAAELSRHASTRWFLGRSADLLRRGARLDRADTQIGMIAGTRRLGLGRFFARFDGPHDGTVALAETRIDGLADHVAIPATHSGLIFSPQAAVLTARFLREGRFG